jgi:AraC family ethanolamine operon transcriptional activator
MPGSVTSLFSEPENLEAALCEDGCLGLLIAGLAQFRARLTRLTLHRLRLSAAEEQLARIAFIAVPADMILILFPNRSGTAPVCGGIGVRAGEIIAVGSGQRVHVRTGGLCRWGAIWLPVTDLALYGSALAGAPFAAPVGVKCWSPEPADVRHLTQLHAAAIRVARSRPHAFLDAYVVHGLEQQLIEVLIDCLSAVAATKGTAAACRATTGATAQPHQNIMAGFEGLIRIHSDRNPRMSEICVELDVSNRQLRSLCAQHLGMSGTGYIRLRRMSLVRRNLRHADRDTATVSEIARRYGFRDLGRFAANYRGTFGELPSATLQRGSGRKLVDRL